MNTSLATRCSTLADAARDAMVWVRDPENSETTGPARKQILRDLQRQARRANRLSAAAERNTAVSVFGPSQAGKSFLVSVLARPDGGRLVAAYDDSELDYIKQINPEGQGESTGLVTRFTMDRNDAPKGYPIPVSLLSESDLIRTILNSFYMDGDQSEERPEGSALSEHIERFTTRAGSAVPGLDSDDVWDVADYVDNNFGRSAYAAAMKGFWDDAAELAPRLSLSDRTAFLSILWGRHQAFSDLYLKLASALSDLEHAREAHLSISALQPRDTSIIDVKTLHLLSTNENAGEIEVILPSGRVSIVDRAVLCALTAELVLPMRDLPHELFARTDLLDFPGARNRFEQPLATTLAAAQSNITELLLRGKVAYLFDRYVENQEITSMLLCIPDGPMETLDLPGLVDRWIALTHGDRPERRSHDDCILFFALTKFDTLLSDSAAEAGDTTRFDRRLQASLLEKFGRGTDPWVSDWTPGKPFSNSFWLRNPNYYVEAIYDYDQDGRETLRENKASRLTDLRQGYLDAETVQCHFADPSAAWKAAIAPNDGGVSYLVSKLERACDPDAKARQIEQQLNSLALSMEASLSPYHVSDDVSERIETAKAAADHVMDGLEYALEQGRFGAVLRTFMVDQDKIADRIATVPVSVRISAAGAGSRAAADTGLVSAPSRRRIRPRAAETASPPAETSAPGAFGETEVRVMTREAFQAETALQTWFDALASVRSDAAAARRIGLDDEATASLASELTQSVQRVGLTSKLADRLSAVSFGLTVDQQARPASLVCAEVINRFVETLGFGDLPETERPKVALDDGTSHPVFALRPDRTSVSDLPQVPRNTVEQRWIDWVHALDAMYQANARHTEGGTVNIEQNLRLGQILETVRTTT